MAGCYLFVWMRAVVTQNQVGSSGMKQQVGGFKRQDEALHSLTEVKGVPQVFVGGVYKKVLENDRKKG